MSLKYHLLTNDLLGVGDNQDSPVRYYMATCINLLRVSLGFHVTFARSISEIKTDYFF